MAVRTDDRPAPDLVLIGDVYTVDSASRWAEAIAVRSGRLVAVGGASEIEGLAGPATETLDLSDRMIIPAFQDAHAHPIHGGMIGMRCSLYDAGSVDECLERVQDYAADNPDANWILGAGWSMDLFSGGSPSRHHLDRFVEDRPVYLSNSDFHGAWVNSRALALAGVTRETPDPTDGRIERDAYGDPSGLLHEGAMNLVEAIAPAPTESELDGGLRNAQRYLLSLGITAWQDAWIEDAELETYIRGARSGELESRVVLSLHWDRHRGAEQISELLEKRSEATFGPIVANTVKIFLDGVAESFTAAMLDPYLDEFGSPTGNRGIEMIEPAALNEFVTLLDAEGFQIHFHAIGDRAVRNGLDAIEAARGANGPRDARHHIAHIQVVHPDDVPRFRELAVVPNGQPLWACADRYMTELTIPFLGPERARHQYPFASLRRAGATLAFGSDWPVSSPNPLLEIEVAVRRTSPNERDAEPFLPEERLDLPAALAAFTMGAAYVNHLDADGGSIEVGKVADIAVLDRNLFDPAAGPIGDARVDMTFVGGRRVFDRSTILGS